MKIFVFGSSITSSYWNGAATYYRGCYKYLARLGHTITFAEPDAFGRQDHRDSDDFSYVESIVYEPGRGVEAMLRRAQRADAVILHSGIGADDDLLQRRVVDLCPYALVFFWDVDAPATIAQLQSNPRHPLLAGICKFDAVFTYGGGPVIREAYKSLGARRYYSVYNGLDVETHHPVPASAALACDLAFVGNRLPDRERRVEELFLEAAKLAPGKRFILGGEGWGDKALPRNVRYIGHVPTGLHNRVNCSAGMVLNINRSSMASSGYSPPTRIFEAAGAGTCLLCDEWPGINDFFEPGRELIVVRSAQDVADAVTRYDAAARRRIGNAFCARALCDHTYARRAQVAHNAFVDCMAWRHAAHAESISSPSVMSGEAA